MHPKHTVLPQWWLKLAEDGMSPATPLASMHRHPFEAVLLLQHADAGANGAANGTAAAAAPPPHPRQAAQLADGLVFLSVPSQHSRKPHLGPLLRAHLPAASSACLTGAAAALGVGAGVAATAAAVDGAAPGHAASGCGPGDGAGGQLELFARELQPGWTSVGDEVLMFQGVP